mgnify:CR=1 FL=1
MNNKERKKVRKEGKKGFMEMPSRLPCCTFSTIHPYSYTQRLSREKGEEKLMWSVMKETFIEHLLDRVVGVFKERKRKRMLSDIEFSKVLFLVLLCMLATSIELYTKINNFLQKMLALIFFFNF